MAEDKGKEEEKFDFTAEGEGYISLDEARVLAMRTAVASPGDYGSQYQGVAMVFDIVEGTETDDHYIVILSFHPRDKFSGTPGQERFFVGKEGTIAVRQVLSSPVRKSGGFPVIPVAFGLVVVGAIAAVGAVLVLMGSGGDSVPIAVVPPTETPVPRSFYIDVYEAIDEFGFQEGVRKIAESYSYSLDVVIEEMRWNSPVEFRAYMMERVVGAGFAEGSVTCDVYDNSLDDLSRDRLEQVSFWFGFEDTPTEIHITPDEIFVTPCQTPYPTSTNRPTPLPTATHYPTPAPHPSIAADPVHFSVFTKSGLFGLDYLTVTTGTEVSLSLSNLGPSGKCHNLVIIQDGTKDEITTEHRVTLNFSRLESDYRVIAFTEKVCNRDLRRIRFIAPAPGKYQFVCMMHGGHGDENVGDFIVTPLTSSSTLTPTPPPSPTGSLQNGARRARATGSSTTRVATTRLASPWHQMAASTLQTRTIAGYRSSQSGSRA